VERILTPQVKGTTPKPSVSVLLLTLTADEITPAPTDSILTPKMLAGKTASNSLGDIIISLANDIIVLPPSCDIFLSPSEDIIVSPSDDIFLSSSNVDILPEPSCDTKCVTLNPLQYSCVQDRSPENIVDNESSVIFEDDRLSKLNHVTISNDLVDVPVVIIPDVLENGVDKKEQASTSAEKPDTRSRVTDTDEIRSNQPLSVQQPEDQGLAGDAGIISIATQRPAMTMQQVVMQARARARLRQVVRARRARKQHQEKQLDRKAAKTLSAILLAFVITWTPYNVFILVQVFCADCIPETVYNIGKIAQLFLLC